MCRLDDPLDHGFDDPYLTKIGYGLILAAIVVGLIVLLVATR